MIEVAAATAATLLVLAAGGWRLRQEWSELPFRYAIGAVGLHLVLTATHLLGIRWSLGLVCCAAAGSFLATVNRFGSEGPRGQAGDRRWGMWVASVLSVLLVFLAFQGWVTQPDFFYHWGLKAGRYFEIRAVDYAFLASPSAWRTHPDYPNLVPELFLLPALIVGRFEERAALLVGASWMVGVVWAFRSVLIAGGCRGFRLEVAHAWGASVVLAFAAGHPLVGSADALPGLALLLAAPALLEPISSAAGLQRLGVAAALAAASKIEGVPLALLLMTLGTAKLLRDRFQAGARCWGSLAGSWVVVAAVMLPWWTMAQIHDLFLSSNVGPLEFSRIPEILRGWLWVATLPEWAGAPWVLVGLPLLVIDRELRFAALACLAHLGIQVGAYLAAVDVDFSFLVAASAPRLMFQVVPTVLALALAGCLREGRDLRIRT